MSGYRSVLAYVSAAALAALTLVEPVSGQDLQALAGRYAYVAAQSDTVDQAIDRAVAGLNFLFRPIGRHRLRKTNAPYQKLLLEISGDQIAITRDDNPPIRTPADGTSVSWTREDGEVMKVSTAWRDGRLAQTFAAEDGRRVNEFSLAPDGQHLTMQVTVTSPRLDVPLQYRLAYRRVDAPE